MNAPKKFKKVYAPGGQLLNPDGSPAALSSTTNAIVGASSIVGGIADAVSPPNKYGRQSGLATGLKQGASYAAAGAAFGPWGAAIGGAIGLGAGLIGSIGKKKTENALDRQEAYNTEESSLAQGQASIAADPTKVYGNRYAQAFADGGSLAKRDNTKVIPQNIKAPSKNLPGQIISERDGVESNWLGKSAVALKLDNPGFGKESDLYRYYSGQPLKNNVLSVGTYRPSNSKDPNAKYVAINDPDFQQQVVDNYNRASSGKLNVSGKGQMDEEQTGPNTYNVSGYRQLGSKALGHYTVSKGKDDKGDYISYYDKFNMTPGKQFGKDWIEGTLGLEPFEIYDRIHLDSNGKPITNVQKPLLNKELMLSNKFADGGELDPDQGKPKALKQVNIVGKRPGPVVVTDPNDYRLAKYNDSLVLSNLPKGWVPPSQVDRYSRLESRMKENLGMLGTPDVVGHQTNIPSGGNVGDSRFPVYPAPKQRVVYNPNPKALVTHDPNDPKIRAYNDSLTLSKIPMFVSGQDNVTKTFRTENGALKDLKSMGIDMYGTQRLPREFVKDKGFNPPGAWATFTGYPSPSQPVVYEPKSNNVQGNKTPTKRISSAPTNITTTPQSLGADPTKPLSPTNRLMVDDGNGGSKPWGNPIHDEPVQPTRLYPTGTIAPKDMDYLRSIAPKDPALSRSLNNPINKPGEVALYGESDSDLLKGYLKAKAAGKIKAFGGQVDDSLTTAKLPGGTLNQLSSTASEVNGDSHAEGGVTLPSGNEVEGGESISNGFVFSKKLGFADLHKPIAKAIGKVEDKPMNPIRRKTLEILHGREQGLALSQEYLKKQLGIPSDID